MSNGWKAVLVAIGAVVFFGSVSSWSDGQPSSTPNDPVTELVEAVDDSFDNESSGQENAREQAVNYLDSQAFSRKGLIEQLKYEGYSRLDAVYAADNVRVDWYEQAALKAKSYLDAQSFSRSGLLDQLLYEGFTRAQAEHGVSVAY